MLTFAPGRRDARPPPCAVGISQLLLVWHLALAPAVAQPAPPGGFLPDLPDAQTLFDAFIDEIGAQEWYAQHAAMVQAESAWRVYAESPYAQGWAQFTPPTRGDWWKRIPGCEDADPFDPRCNILAMDIYMRHLYRRSLAMTQNPDSAMAMARRSYNGGLGWQIREHRLCLATPGCDPDDWEHLARLCMEAGRSEAACAENSSYPLKIEKAEPAYRKRRKGWKRKILRGIAIGASVAQGRVPEIR